MNIVIDIDGTICEERGTFERSLAAPLPHAVSAIQKLVKDGHHIILFSARSWSEYNMTEHWLKEHNIPYHQLMLGKVGYDVWIDDRAIKFKDWPATLKELKKV